MLSHAGIVIRLDCAKRLTGEHCGHFIVTGQQNFKILNEYPESETDIRLFLYAVFSLKQVAPPLIHTLKPFQKKKIFKFEANSPVWPLRRI
jgi:hypothetical protein